MGSTLEADAVARIDRGSRRHLPLWGERWCWLDLRRVDAVRRRDQGASGWASGARGRRARPGHAPSLRDLLAGLPYRTSLLGRSLDDGDGRDHHVPVAAGPINSARRTGTSGISARRGHLLRRRGRLTRRPSGARPLLDRSRRQAGDDAALEEEHQDHQRNRHDDARGHLAAERCDELRSAGELRDRRPERSSWTACWSSTARSGTRSRPSTKVMIAVVNTPGAASGRITLRNAWPRVQPSTTRRLLELAGHLPEERGQVPHRQRQRERHARHDHRLVGVDPVDVDEQLQQRNDQRDHREHRGGDDAWRAPAA